MVVDGYDNLICGTGFIKRMIGEERRGGFL
jgi:hypothetical protein